MSVTGWGGVTLTVEVDLSQAVEDIGAVVTSTGSLWDVGKWDEDVWLEGTQWTDVTAYVLGWSSDRAMSWDIQAYNAGQMKLRLDNSDGRFSPDNTNSPYRVGASTTIGVQRPIRIRASYGGVEFAPFTGRIETWDEFYDGVQGGYVEVTAVDAFAELGAADGYEQTPAGAGEGYAARMNRILDNAGHTGERRIDAGSHTFQATNLAKNALTELKLTADSEGGACWIGGDGIFYADGWDALLTKDRSTTPQVLFSNADDDTAVGFTMYPTNPKYDGSQIVNVAAYARVGSTEQVVTSPGSRQLYGQRRHARTDLVCENDTQVEALAQREVALFQFPEQRIEWLDFDPELQPSAARKVVAWEAVARGLLSLRNLIRVDYTTPAGFTITRMMYVRGIHHDVTADTWRIRVDTASATVPYRMLDSQWDAATWDESVWAW